MNKYIFWCMTVLKHMQSLGKSKKRSQREDHKNTFFYISIYSKGIFKVIFVVLF